MRDEIITQGEIEPPSHYSLLNIIIINDWESLKCT